MITRVIYFFSQVLATTGLLAAWLWIGVFSGFRADINREFDIIFGFIWKSFDD